MPDKKNTNRASEEGFGGKRHELEIRDRLVLLRGIISTLDLCLQSLTVRRDKELMETLRFERAEVAQELVRARRELRMAENDGFVS